MYLNKIFTTCLGLLTLIASSLVYANENLNEPVELLVKFNITGNFTGMTDDTPPQPIYTIGGPGFAAITTSSSEILDLAPTGLEVAQLQGAQITFAGQQTDPVIEFTCLAGSCSIVFDDGSVLESNAGVPLTGRAINMWGPVINSPDFDPANGIFPTRILGCGGLKETAGEGKLAGMVGSICFNGVLNFNQNDPSTLTGGSNCTITMHTPDPMIPIP